MRYFIRLAYDGTPYHGWQRQPNAVSVQQVLEEALSTVMRCPIAVTGAGRTDTGVNAREMYAHFDIDTEVADTRRLAISLDRMCGRSICVYDVMRVPDTMHARFDAIERTYKYFVSFHPSPFFAGRSWFSPTPLDIEMMNRAAAILTTTDDFTSFAKLHSDAKTNICRVTHALWTPLSIDCGGENDIDAGIVLTISADRFLRNMVRAVVGTLVEVGRGKLSLDGFRQVIEAKDRCRAGTSMPPEPLYLWQVKYPDF